MHFNTNSYQIRGLRMEKQAVSEAIYRLNLAINQIDGAYYYYSRSVGEKENATALLYALGDGKPHSQKEISRDWLIPITTVNTIVRDYRERGLVELHEQPGSREKSLCLTAEGKALAAERLRGLHEAEDAAVQATVQRFSPAFVDALACFAEALRKELQIPVHKEETT